MSRCLNPYGWSHDPAARTPVADDLSREKLIEDDVPFAAAKIGT